MHIKAPHRSIVSHFALGSVLVGAIGSSVGVAAPLEGPDAPIPATSCPAATVEIEIDVATGDVYVLDPSTGTLEPAGDEIEVYFGSLGHVQVKLHYSSSEWTVGVTPDEDPTVYYGTVDGWLRYTISDDYDEYVFSSAEVTAPMAAMIPVVPDIKLATRNECPPS